MFQVLDARVAENFEVINKRLSYCASNVELDKLKYQLQSYATLEAMQAFRDEIRPIMDGCNV
jgi:hypothetical protein